MEAIPEDHTLEVPNAVAREKETRIGATPKALEKPKEKTQRVNQKEKTEETLEEKDHTLMPAAVARQIPRPLINNTKDKTAKAAQKHKDLQKKDGANIKQTGKEPNIKTSPGTKMDLPSIDCSLH